jgi:hypothetical protein
MVGEQKSWADLLVGWDVEEQYLNSKKQSLRGVTDESRCVNEQDQS